MKILLLILTMLIAGGTAQANTSAGTFAVNVTGGGSSGCPTSPPPQAAAAGYTTLLYSLCPADPKYQNFPGWVDCSVTDANTFEWYIVPTGIKFSCSNNLSIVTDATTGDTVLDYHYFSDTDPLPPSAWCHPFPTSTCGYPPNQAYVHWRSQSNKTKLGGLPNNGTFPIGTYTEVAFRNTANSGQTPPNVVDPPCTGTGCNKWPLVQTPFDFFYWDEYYITHSQVFDEGPIERNIMEDYGPRASRGGSAMHDWGAKNQGPGNDYVMSKVETQTPGSFAAGVTAMHRYGWLTTSDGTEFMQQCFFIDNVMTHSTFANADFNCQPVQDFTATNSDCFWSFYAGGITTIPPFNAACNPDETYHFIARPFLQIWWGGLYGPDTLYCQYYGSDLNNWDPVTNPSPCTRQGGQPDSDVYIKYVQVWGCANGNTTDPTCVANGVTPVAIERSFLGGGVSGSFASPSTGTEDLGALTSTCSGGACPAITYTLSNGIAPAQGTCVFPNVAQVPNLFEGYDNADFTISGGHLHPIAGLTSVTGAAGPKPLASIGVTSGGSGLTATPTVMISDPTGTGAAASAVVQNGTVTAITLTNPGTNYTNPTVTFSSGNATAVANIGGGHIANGGTFGNGAYMLCVKAAASGYTSQYTQFLVTGH